MTGCSLSRWVGVIFMRCFASFTIFGTCRIGHFESHISNFSSKFCNFRLPTAGRCISYFSEYSKDFAFFKIKRGGVFGVSRFIIFHVDSSCLYTFAKKLLLIFAVAHPSRTYFIKMHGSWKSMSKRDLSMKLFQFFSRRFMKWNATIILTLFFSIHTNWPK